MNKLGQTGTTTWKYSGKTSKRVRYVTLVKNSLVGVSALDFIGGMISPMRRDNVLGKK